MNDHRHVDREIADRLPRPSRALPDGDNGCDISAKMLKSPLFRFLLWKHLLSPDKPREATQKYLDDLLDESRASRHVQQAVLLGLLEAPSQPICRLVGRPFHPGLTLNRIFRVPSSAGCLLPWTPELEGVRPTVGGEEPTPRFGRHPNHDSAIHLIVGQCRSRTSHRPWNDRTHTEFRSTATGPLCQKNPSHRLRHWPAAGQGWFPVCPNSPTSP
jgi:hypothetical protein